MNPGTIWGGQINVFTPDKGHILKIIQRLPTPEDKNKLRLLRLTRFRNISINLNALI